MTGQNTNNLSDAIRNLIVCDTQFGWTGETTLKLPELLDLQARGWLIEGDENCEFSLTDEGRAVVARARALQQDAPAELAEQQGDARAQFEAWMTDTAKIIVGSNDPYPAGLERDYWRVWQAALAARQPGAQVPAVCADEFLLGELDEAAEHGSTLSVTYLRELARRSAAALRSADPVVSAHAANLQGGLDAAERISGLLRQQLADAAPPAQGIDLGQLRALAEQWKRMEYPLSYEGQQAQRAADACRADLLALIDQRDAAPGGANA